MTKKKIIIKKNKKCLTFQDNVDKENFTMSPQIQLLKI